jgi:tripartite ATP-independent transporter DctM subunit
VGQGVQNAAVLVQHLGLVMAMFGAVAAERSGHLATFGSGVSGTTPFAMYTKQAALAATGVVCGVLAWASWQFVASERLAASPSLAYGIPAWWIQASLPFGFWALGMKVSARVSNAKGLKLLLCLLIPGLGIVFGQHLEDLAGSWWPLATGLVLMLVIGCPVFAVLGALALGLCWQGGLPLASLALSHYQITVNPSLPSLPLFTLAGLVFANTGAAKRLGLVFTTLSGNGTTGTVVASAVLCSCFTALTGGSGVTILALGGLLLPLLVNSGFPEKKSVSLITSASALGVLLAPSVPLIMYAVIARVPVNTMLLAGVVPAMLMVVFLLLGGGYLSGNSLTERVRSPGTDRQVLLRAVNAAKWELFTPIVAIGSLVSGLATPVESAALTAMYALLTQSLAHRELSAAVLRKCLRDASQIIGGVMLILGMALGITNCLVDAGIPDIATEWDRLSDCLELIPAGRRGIDGNFCCDCGVGSAAVARGGKLWHRPGPFRHHFFGQPGNGFSLSACRHESLFRLGNVQETHARNRVVRVARPGCHFPGHHDHLVDSRRGDGIAAMAAGQGHNLRVGAAAESVQRLGER